MDSEINQATVQTGGGKGIYRLNMEDALNFLDQIRKTFESTRPQVYNEFLDIMKAFKSECMDTPTVIARVMDLFKDHVELIVAFNSFLPPMHRVSMHAYYSNQGAAAVAAVSTESTASDGKQCVNSEFRDVVLESEYGSTEMETENKMDKNRDCDTEALASNLEAMALFKDIESSFEICDAEGEFDEPRTEQPKSYYERCLLS